MKKIIVNFVTSNTFIMDTIEIKDYLHKQIEELDDDRLLNAIYAMLQTYTQQSKSSKLSPDQIKELERRKQRHLSGESKSYSWQEVKSRIKQ